MDTGAYQLLILLKEPREIAVGQLAIVSFPAGYYIYTGSARSGLDARIARHLRREKRLHWHVDYLLQHAEVVSVRRIVTGEKIECRLNAEALARKGARIVAEGFGSSDCRCASHLVYLGEDNETTNRQEEWLPDSPPHL